MISIRKYLKIYEILTLRTLAFKYIFVLFFSLRQIVIV